MTKPQALYVHVPFCQRFCAYCDFCRVLYQKDKVAQYLKVLKQELSELDYFDFKTVFIGGGTPSALSSDELEILLEALAPFLNNVEEFTIEVNPESVTKEKIAVMVKAGINRVSIGVQAIQPEILKYIKRFHNYNDVKRVVNNFKEAGITNISVDLMYGILNQTWEDVAASIEACNDLDIEHLSLYCLIIEEESEFGKANVAPLSEEEDARIYQNAVTLLKKLGYQQYEISNFSKNHKKSLHNLVYWHYQDFIGVGPSAAGKLKMTRFQNSFELDEYLTDYKKSRVITNLSLEDCYFEYLMMNLRLNTGFLRSDFKERFQVDAYQLYQETFDKLIAQDLIVVSDSIYCTEKGFLLLNEVLLEFMPE